MNKKIIKKIISFTLCAVLFILDIIYLMLFNISRGINKNEITKLIDDINIKEEFEYLDSYKELEYTEQQLINEIFDSAEFEEYVKENIKIIYLNICYEENIKYVDSNILLTYVNNKIEEQQMIYGITDESIEKISNITNEIVEKTDAKIKIIEESKEDTKIIKEIMSKKTSNYLLIGIIIISILILLVNKSYEGIIWLGIPTLISGSLFLLLALSLDGTINIIDINTYTITTSLKTLFKVIKVSSITFVSIGIVESLSYIIIKYLGEKNGNN